MGSNKGRIKHYCPRVGPASLHLDLIGARPVGDLEQLLEQAIGALFARAYMSEKSSSHRSLAIGQYISAIYTYKETPAASLVKHVRLPSRKPFNAYDRRGAWP
jgi:hypothetical protein